MDKEIHDFITQLISHDFTGSLDDLEKKFQLIYNFLKDNENEVQKIQPANYQLECDQWKIITMSFSILLSTKSYDSVININYIQDIKKLVGFVVKIGILPFLLPCLYLKQERNLLNTTFDMSNVSIDIQYYIFSGTVKGLVHCLKLSPVRNYLFANHFYEFLAALFQLCYASIKNPKNVDHAVTLMDDFYSQINTDKDFFQNSLDNVIYNTHSPQIMRELMVFYGKEDSPKWLKRVIYKILYKKLELVYGVEFLIRAILDRESLDTGNWQHVEIVYKLLMTKPPRANNYYDKICKQIKNIIDNQEKNGIYNKTFLQVASCCIKYLYEIDKDNFEKYFLTFLVEKLLKYSNKDNTDIFDDQTIQVMKQESDNITYVIVTDEIKKNISFLHLCFVETSFTLQPLPMALLTPAMTVIFELYLALHKSKFDELKNNLKDLLLKGISSAGNILKNELFDAFLFETQSAEIFLLKDCIEIFHDDEDIKIMKPNLLNAQINCVAKSEAIIDLIQGTDVENVIIPLVMFLLETAHDIKPLTKQSFKDLLDIDIMELLSDKSLERKTISYMLLSNFIQNETVQKYIQKEPQNLLYFVEVILNNHIESNTHKSTEVDTEPYQSMYIMIMIIKIIIENLTSDIISNGLRNALLKIYNETPDMEIKTFIKNTLEFQPSEKIPSQSMSTYEKAIYDLTDPALAIRGHGLLTLSKLLEENDPEALANEQYILNICLHLLEEEDSYIYLSAIKVVAILGNHFPETVINILTDEYSNDSKYLFQVDYQNRLKVGEVLLKVVKSLGEMAVNYKAILLNTFLSGVRNEDNLTRASSLSNLGELCRVLGYKLGSIVTEVLTCIHAVILTDKAVEARRAAVSVIRYLFVGLAKETIIVLKDEILPIYHTLKMVYESDYDDITRLHAQLALEELNANVQDFIFPTIKLEKKLVMLA